MPTYGSFFILFYTKTFNFVSNRYFQLVPLRIRKKSVAIILLIVFENIYMLFAFDTISVPLLISKLFDLGVWGTASELFKDYQTSCKQEVKLKIKRIYKCKGRNNFWRPPEPCSALSIF